MKKAIVFLKEVKIELSKVVWPTRKQAFKLTLAVILISLAVALYVGVIDYLLTKALTLVVGG